MARLRMRDTRNLDSFAGSATAHAALTTTAHGGIVADDDARLSDPRTPTAHAASHMTGADRLQVSTTDRILGRLSAGAGNVEEITCTSAARSILDDATIAAIRATLGLDTGDSPTFNTINGLTFNAQKSYEYCAFLLDMCSSCRLLIPFLEAISSGGTAADLSGNSNNATYVAASSWSDTDRTYKGFGFTVTFNGSKYLTVADADNLSFGDGTNDSAFTILALVNISSSGATEIIARKGSNAGHAHREWSFGLVTGNRPQLALSDASANKVSYSTVNAGIANGYHLIAVVYDGTGGATAANGITFYCDGVVVASTATNDASYVAMENLAQAIGIGASNAGDLKMSGNLSVMLADASAWTLAKIWQTYTRTRGQFSL